MLGKLSHRYANHPGRQKVIDIWPYDAMHHRHSVREILAKNR